MARQTTRAERRRQARAQAKRDRQEGPPARKSRGRLVGVSLGVVVLLVTIWALTRTGQREPIPVFDHVVQARYPHDEAAYCQGLLFDGEHLYESTGKLGESSVRRVNLTTGEVLAHRNLEPDLFGEGLALWQDRLIQLTWRSGRALVRDRHTLEVRQELTYPGEGWGLTHDGEHLILSDGTAVLRFLDPDTFQEVRRVEVHAGGRPLPWLNELEFVNGEVLANVWRTDRIACIDPVRGEVTGWIDLTGLRPPSTADEVDNVLNGIAHDDATGRLFVTGKRWPALFEIDVRR